MDILIDSACISNSNARQELALGFIQDIGVVSLQIDMRLIDSESLLCVLVWDQQDIDFSA